MIPAMNILGVLTDFSAPWIHQAALLFAVTPDNLADKPPGQAPWPKFLLLWPGGTENFQAEGGATGHWEDPPQGSQGIVVFKWSHYMKQKTKEQTKNKIS